MIFKNNKYRQMKTLKLLVFGLLISQLSFGQITNPNVLKKVGELPKINYLKKINKAVWIGLLNNTLRNSYLKINNYDPAGTDAGGNFQYYKKDDVKLRLGRPPLGVEQVFTLEPLRYEPLTVYFKNINSNRTNIDAKNKKIQFFVSFEKEDVEITVDCVRNLVCGGLGKPQFQVDDLSFNIEIEPYAENGKIRYRNAKARVSANAGHDGFNFIFSQLEPFTRAMNGPLFDLFSNEITNYLNQDSTIDLISEKLMAGFVTNGSFLGVNSGNVFFTQFYVDEDGNLMYNIK